MGDEKILYVGDRTGPACPPFLFQQPAAGLGGPPRAAGCKSREKAAPPFLFLRPTAGLDGLSRTAGSKSREKAALRCLDPRPGGRRETGRAALHCLDPRPDGRGKLGRAWAVLLAAWRGHQPRTHREWSEENKDQSQFHQGDPQVSRQAPRWGKEPEKCRDPRNHPVPGEGLSQG